MEDRKNKKNKRSGENRRGKRGRGSHCRNKVNLVIGKSSGSKISVYYHIIYQFY